MGPEFMHRWAPLHAEREGHSMMAARRTRSDKKGTKQGNRGRQREAHKGSTQGRCMHASTDEKKGGKEKPR